MWGKRCKTEICWFYLRQRWAQTDKETVRAREERERGERAQQEEYSEDAT